MNRDPIHAALQQAFPDKKIRMHSPWMVVLEFSGMMFVLVMIARVIMFAGGMP